MPSPNGLAFLTPVYQRFALTEICLKQRRWVCDELKSRYGLDATCIVVGLDENLDVAAKLGFETVEHPNEAVHMGHTHVALGQKFNAAYKRAHRMGIDYVFPIGSDSWIDPVYFDELPEENELLLSRAYNLVTATTERRGALWITWEGGVQWITHVADWEHRNYEPVSPSLAKGCDSSTWLHKKPGVKIRENHHHQLEYVAFQSRTEQITNYATVMHKFGKGEVTGPDVFGGLTPFYRREDILAIRAHYVQVLREEIEAQIEVVQQEAALYYDRRITLEAEAQALHVEMMELA